MRSLQSLLAVTLLVPLGQTPPIVDVVPAAAADPFGAYLSHAYPPADGFELPVVADGLQLRTGFGERRGAELTTAELWRAPAAAPVVAIANGRVAFAGDSGGELQRFVVVEHLLYENHERLELRSLTAGLARLFVNAGDVVRRGQVIGVLPTRGARLHLELRRDPMLPVAELAPAAPRDVATLRRRFIEPTRFVSEHAELFVPHSEPQLLLIDHETRAMRLYRAGVAVGEYQLGFGLATGRKRWRGDERTPKGMYFVIRRHRGDFDGEYGDYFGGHWLKINYPNPFDAAWGAPKGLVTDEQVETIASAWRARQPTLGKTKLGGSIGLHGWIEEWEDSWPRGMTWGCIVMHNRDIARLYDLIPTGTMVVIF